MLYGAGRLRDAKEDTMTRKELIARCKELTMACWWPSEVFARPTTDWDGILGELCMLREYPGIPVDLEQVIEFANTQA